MKTEQLILQLSTEAKPTVAFMPVKSWLLWSLAPMTVMILRFFLWQTQSPNLTKNFDLAFLQETILLGLLFGLVPYLTFKQSVPGFKNSKLMFLTGFLFSGWIILLILRATRADMADTQSAHFSEGLACSYEILQMALVPLAVLFFILRRGASVHPLRSGIMAATSATMMGTLVLQVICQSPSPVHILAYHVGAVLAISLLGAFLGLRILRW